ncbi:YhdB family protein [Siminovitchia fortis]|uniref:YhdB-like protein n=1 Tax=Siminovitchia fortis TaxID=254758 RepID=A0A443J2F7_9BACI|nr:YhdB family protein [Siminovitchia fortis]RWR14632.1 hypothetical protein D4N35_002305 [Siminovitchia fortis]WHY80314.1 YhdB family protein [Siminovitchia fortis]
MLDYDRALYYTHRSEWDNLIVLMVRTKDDMLSKRIEHFLHAYYFSRDYSLIERRLFSLLRFLEHAAAVVDSKDIFEEYPLIRM